MAFVPSAMGAVEDERRRRCAKRPRASPSFLSPVPTAVAVSSCHGRRRRVRSQLEGMVRRGTATDEAEERGGSKRRGDGDDDDDDNAEGGGALWAPTTTTAAAPPRTQPEASPSEWRALIEEFEERAAKRGDYVPLEDRSYDEDGLDEFAMGEKENPEVFKYLDLSEASSMVAFTVTMWWWGKVMRLDSWFQLFYSFPVVFVGMRWGPYLGTLSVFASWFWVNFTLGPYSGLSYMTTQGLSSLVLIRGFWHDWPTSLVMLLSIAAKMFGFLSLIVIISFFYQQNVLAALAQQAQALLDSIGRKVFSSSWSGPTAFQIQMGIVLSFLLHSIVFSVFSHLTTTLLLHRFARHLERLPRMLPILSWAINRANENYRAKYGYDVEDTW